MPASDHINIPQFNPENEFYGKMSEMVPISVLKEMRGNDLRYEGAELINLAEDIKKNGLRNPGMLEYYQPSRNAYLGEGNHRLAALEMAGYTHMPVTVFRNEHSDTRGKAKPVRGIEPDRHGYVPGNLKPSQIMDWDD
ncbi:hypothetical protein EBT25_15460 [bacterium]|jgi:hypothetical protein|nr:hypothetical protein [bacterium]